MLDDLDIFRLICSFTFLLTTLLLVRSMPSDENTLVFTKADTLATPPNAHYSVTTSFIFQLANGKSSIVKFITKMYIVRTVAIWRDSLILSTYFSSDANANDCLPLFQHFFGLIWNNSVGRKIIFRNNFLSPLLCFPKNYPRHTRVSFVV